MALSQVGLERLNTDTTDKIGTNKNVVINGSFSIWQRGTSIDSQGNGQNDYTADRFAIGHNNSHMAAVTQQDGTGTNAGFRYCARIQRDSGNSQTDQLRFHTAFETNNVIPLRGKKLTLSFYARKGANYSEANSKITNVLVATGENTDGNPNAYAGGSWTNASNIINGTDATLTTDWQRFTYTSSTVSNTTNSMIIEFRVTPVGTAGANDYYEITGVQLEINSVATDFEHRSFAQELALCQRYFYEICLHSQSTTPICQATDFDGSFSYGNIPFPVSMRTKPSMGQVAGTNYFKLYGGTATIPINAANKLVFSEAGLTGAEIKINNEGNSGMGRANFLRATNSAARLNFIAEL